VREPLVGVVPWLPSLEVSVERSVLKEALDLRLNSLKLKIDGAMSGADQELPVSGSSSAWNLRRGVERELGSLLSGAR
jgi:hypothetical protein